MPLCKQPTSEFVAEEGNIWNIREGWLANAADDLAPQPTGGTKRYVSLDMTNDDGVLQNVMHDCPNDCDGIGNRYTANFDGRIKDYGVALGGVNPCTAIITLSMNINWNPDPFFSCWNQAILWWATNHVERTVTKPMQGDFPLCFMEDLSPSTPYPADPFCGTPLIGTDTFPDCVHPQQACTGLLGQPDPPLNFVYAFGMNGIFFSIRDDGDTVEIICGSEPVPFPTTLDIGFYNGGNDNDGNHVCCSDPQFLLLRPALIYTGPPLNPQWPATDSRRYEGNYSLTRPEYPPASPGIQTGTATVSFS